MAAIANRNFDRNGRFALKYRAVGGEEQVLTDLSNTQVVAKIGEVLWAAHCRHLKLEYVRTVSFNKKPGRKPIVDASRETCTEDELRTFCKKAHQAWLASC